jgi:hypothetical protein
MLERALRIDINGDGIIGRLPDVVPGRPAFFGYSTIPYTVECKSFCPWCCMYIFEGTY